MRVIAVLLFLSVSLADCYKILGIFPFGSKSHYAIGEATMRAINEAGHEVTMISVFEPKNRKNYTQIKIPDFQPKMEEGKEINAFEFAKMNPLLMFFFLFSMGPQLVEHAMSTDSIQQLLNSNEKFDAVVVELFAIDAMLGFGQHFGCPVIGVSTFDAIYWNDVFTGNQSPYSYVPAAFLGLPDKMSFMQRLWNTIFSGVEKTMYNFYNLYNQRKLYEKFFPKATKTFAEVHKDVSLIFTNSHVSTSMARPFLPNVIGINGIHVQPAKPLPNDIQQFLDSATDGVILFSMGSFVQSTHWTTQQREAFVNVFSKLKEKVIWKYENETLPGNKGNIMIGSWIPQRDIVAHKNVKLFITHGGSLGTTEAISEGVPLLGIPLFGDQMMNLKRAVNKGYALALDFQNITEENVSKAINELLINPKYMANAKRISSIYQDRPLSPQQEVVYWTEHVVRHKGADHLKATARDLSYIEFHNIDVYAILYIAFFGVLFMFYKSVRFCFKKKSPAKKQKQKKN